MTFPILGVEFVKTCELFSACLCSTVSALTYYGICMNVGSFGVDIYSAQFFSGISETPCLLIPLVRLGRRALTMLTLVLSGTSCFLSLLLSMLDGENFPNYFKMMSHLSSTSWSSKSMRTRPKILCFPAPSEITMTLALLGKLCILASIFISVLYCIELFPTVVR